MKYCVIELLGKQHKVILGEEIFVDRLEVEVGKTFIVEQVLLVVNGDKREIGDPYVKVDVKAKVIEHSKGKKIRVATYKAKSKYRRVKGHRQHQSLIKIVEIGKDTFVEEKKIVKTDKAKLKTRKKKSKKK